MSRQRGMGIGCVLGVLLLGVGEAWSGPVALCSAAPAVGCVDMAQAKFSYDERKAGKEKAKIDLKRGSESVTLADFGDPEVESSVIGVCIYNAASALAGVLEVETDPGEDCAGKPCWITKAGKQHQYKDKLNSRSGVSKIQFKPGSDKARTVVQGKNNSPKGQVALPTGVVAGLAGGLSVTVQVLTNEECFSATLGDVKEKPGSFSAKLKP